jgi:hypothetical protein
MKGRVVLSPTSRKKKKNKRRKKGEKVAKEANLIQKRPDLSQPMLPSIPS